MTEEKMSSYQLGMIIISFFIGSALAINPAVIAKQDAWLAFLFGWGGGLILLWVAIKIAELHPKKSLVGILIDCFGRVLGKLIALVYGWYFIHLSAEVIRTYASYTTTVTYPETPLLFFSVSYSLVVIYSLKVGIETIGRISEVFVPFIILVVLFTFSASLSSMDISNFQPILSQGFLPPLTAGFTTMILPFGEFIIFLMVLPNLNHQNSFKKTSLLAYLIVGCILFIVVCRNLLVLGADMLARDIFPSHIVFRLIPGIDVAPLLDINLIMAGIVKTSICIYASAKLITEVFGLLNYRILLLPLTAFAVSLSMMVRGTVMEQVTVTMEIWPIYSIPFQIIIPLTLLLFSLFNRKNYNHNRT
ncbi:spore germination protein KB [Anaerovirgula multivorans]|uniref:Spore germination protein KB n=1 Tax=Anaerovirgula multivorans TaxID=312168 RepID=A0A239DWV5_9FIRM|nr:endospore germination permease [Anaerovirgula multivorans]SNS36173.1 spore germination protein KB [Anaerovirgula multivorans]